MGAEFLFMDDNACSHRANIVDECLQSEDITRMDWPAYSPDLNPIEHVWDMLGRRIAARHKIRYCWNTSPNLNRNTASSTASTFTSTITSATSGTMSMSGAPAIRKNNSERGIIQKKRIIQMLFVVVLEFFICWSPLYAINTVSLFDPSIVYTNIGYSGISFFQLLAYTSSCCNPVTYCFMNSRFRESFCKLFPCGCRKRR
ncbi:cholecystokinin receptor [Trichonephila clavipes]|nr:cholecystokinin receptor [Trichonephila clavipes]